MPPEPGPAALQAAADSLRLGMEAQAGEALAAFTGWLLECFARPEHAALSEELGPLIGELLDAQQRRDLLRVADLLEFELRPRLPS